MISSNGAPPIRRVAVIAYHSSPLQEPGAGDAGGMTVYVRGLAQALAEQGLSTDVYTRATGPGPRSVEVSPGVRVIAIEAGPLAPVSREVGLGFVDDFVAGVRAYAGGQRARYDLVHSHYWQSGLAGVALATAWQVPLVHSHHTLARVKNKFIAPGDDPEPDSRVTGESVVIDSADVLVASTDEEFEHLACLYQAPHDRLKTLHPGVDHRVFRPLHRARARRAIGVPQDTHMLLAVGRIQKLKGLDLALRSLACLREWGLAAHLVIVGGASGSNGDDELTRLRGLARSLDIVDRVTWAGPQPHKALASYYSAADCLLVCSHSESFGLTALEGHACGTPVVGTAVGGLRHIVKDGNSGFLVDTRDPGLFAGRIRRLLVEPELRARFGVVAQESAAAFSWDSTADEFLELYECLVREDSPELCTC